MVSWAMITNKGERTHNEDMIGQAEKNGAYCFVLADGLGGHGKGEIASQLAVQTVLSDFQKEWENAEIFMENAFEHVQTVILEEQEKNNCKNEMKTTIVCFVIWNEGIQWGFCGDSRLYYFYKKKLKCRTLDHSVPQMLVLSKQLKEKDIRFHEDRNRLLRVMGMESDRKIYEVEEPVKRLGRQQYLLCSDGYWEYVTEKEMTKFLKNSSSPQEWLDRMTEKVIETGTGKNMDNFSAIAIWVDTDK